MLSHGELQLSLLLPMWRTARQSDRGIHPHYVSIFYNRFNQPVLINTSCVVVNLKGSWWLAVGTRLDTALLAYSAVPLLSIIRSLFCCQLYFLNVNLLFCDVSGC